MVKMSNNASNPLLKTLRNKLRELMNDHTDAIAGGACEDFPDYRYKVGLIHGLALAERELLDLDKRVEEA